MDDAEDKYKIIWQPNGIGNKTIYFKKGGSYGTVCLRPKIAIRWTICELYNNLIVSPYLLEKIKSSESKSKVEIYLSNFIVNTLNRAEPLFSNDQILKLRELIPKIIINDLLELINTNKLSLDKSDAEFVLLISLKRNWRQICVICLEHHTGKTCNCGHSEITMFRPCGHTVCSNPCFRELWRSKNFICPICRTLVTKTFDATNIKVSSDITDIDILVETVINKFIRYSNSDNTNNLTNNILTEEEII
jgi:hypothetical protein